MGRRLKAHKVTWVEVAITRLLFSVPHMLLPVLLFSFWNALLFWLPEGLKTFQKECRKQRGSAGSNNPIAIQKQKKNDTNAVKTKFLYIK